MPKASCIMLLEMKLYYAHTMLNYVMGFNLWPKGQAQVLKIEYGRLWLLAAVMLQYSNWQGSKFPNNSTNCIISWGCLLSEMQLKHYLLQRKVQIFITSVCVWAFRIMPQASCIMLCQQLLEMKLYYAHTMLNYVMGFNVWPKGQARCRKLNVADYKQIDKDR